MFSKPGKWNKKCGQYVSVKHHLFGRFGSTQGESYNRSKSATKGQSSASTDTDPKLTTKM